MGRARGTCDIEERYIGDIGAEALRETDHLVDMFIDGILILKQISKK
jgi:hypothetical protein